MSKVALVGATDGIGRALALEYAKAGWQVAVIGRDPAKVRGVVAGLAGGEPEAHVSGVLDLRDHDAIAPALTSAVEALGGLDLFVHCAGVLNEERPDETLDVNARGAIAACAWAAARFEATGSGHVAGIGSVSGDRGRSGNPAYNASKAALHAYLEGLRARLHPKGIRVTTIKPGWVRTRMLGQVPSLPPTISAERAAQLIRRGLARRRDVFYVPWWWGLVSLVLRVTPRFLYKRFAPP